jgi:hypothetical protein
VLSENRKYGGGVASSGKMVVPNMMNFHQFQIYQGRTDGHTDMKIGPLYKIKKQAVN